ncbi:hypothetical protein ABOM_001478 [Aspergillus bombycis]|uniref:Glycophorin A domain protein n=1 Tax=Aspergillus bombycis TaxID=109264 RepID=A0A1F8ADR3_9EURO|nr:hypothetical protein ABOM_001478 [Aspergillus bombycis]OGM49864.1 hypothetical protein ABOM_001478 [Aspergillus bombycis]
MFNHTGFFCCLPEQTGFWTDSPQDAVGCSDGAPTERGETILNTEIQTFSSTSSTSTASTESTSTSAIPAATTTSASDSSNSSSSSNHAGAIAGGVVGGVAGVALIVALLWYFFMRGRKQSQQPPAGEEAVPMASAQNPPKPPTELEARKIQYELESRADQPVHELPTNHY